MYKIILIIIRDCMGYYTDIILENLPSIIFRIIPHYTRILYYVLYKIIRDNIQIFIPNIIWNII